MLRIGKRTRDKVKFQVIEFERWETTAEGFHLVDAVQMNLRKRGVSAVDLQGSLTNLSAPSVACCQLMEQSYRCGVSDEEKKCGKRRC